MRNLLLSTTEDTIERIFSQYGEVERVKKLRDYCFVHFKTREEARMAINAMKGRMAYGQINYYFCGTLDSLIENFRFDYGYDYEIFYSNLLLNHVIFLRHPVLTALES